MNEDIIEQVVATGRLDRFTVTYWVDWLTACGAKPHGLFELIDFIIEKEEYIGDTFRETIPDHWKQD